MTKDQEHEIHGAIKRLRDEVTVVAKNTNSIGLTLFFISIAVIAHVVHHW